ncbi:Myb-like DNA-binding domain-containing protein [Spironucleus salmonicida]|uniref:Myb-like DNA-binding domain-containing protein n=1 Tax=Spironucleus salmonicida TaxID=348837 RepID=V6LG04_9EUKA|nr:Myb-like DNA-binding domain-containing protein [Spironucleus salmonicida]|eukprot:EST43198.1 Myb-like DNA-binding domain-containing protein [Spironucleus salmonicida]
MTNFHWTESKKNILLEAVNTYGNQWVIIQKLYFSQLTVNQIMFKFYYLKKRIENSSEYNNDIKQFIVKEGNVEKLRDTNQ